MARRRGEERARAAEHVVGFAERRFDGVQRDGTYDENGHVREAVIAGIEDGEGHHIRSGAVIPSSASPLRNTSCDARAKHESRAHDWLGLVQHVRLVIPEVNLRAVSCRYVATRCGSSASAAPATSDG